jgi:uncharacterized protein YhaN
LDHLRTGLWYSIRRGGGLHIIYGPNEAGKSSALRALKALLYGVEERTTDNFLHANDKLRIAGCVRTVNERELAFTRRKGRKNTLLTLDGEALDEQALAPFLQGVSAELFETLFGIDHRALVQGGQEILDQKGEVGEALFSASLGSHALHAVLGQLDDEADCLFRPRGSTQKINSALKSYIELNKAIRECSLSSRDWDEHRRVLVKITNDLNQIQSELANMRAKINRLKRIQLVLPKLARRRELLQELGSLAEVVILSDDFGERRQRAVKELETAVAMLQKSTSRLNGLKDQLQGLSVRRAMLEQGESIETLHARLGGYRKAMQDRPHLEAECKQLLADAGSLLKEIRPGMVLKDIDQLCSVFARRQRIIDLGNQKQVLVTHVRQANHIQHETGSRLEELCRKRRQLPEAGSPDRLRRAIAAARKLGDVDSRIQSARSELSTIQAQCDSRLARLGLWDGSLEDLPSLPTPSRESINQYEHEYAELDKKVQRLREKQEELSDALQEGFRQLDEIQGTGSVPMEEDLIDVRSDREQAWRLLRRQWIDGEDVTQEARAFDSQRTLDDAFEYRMRGADELADRLRREADRVHARASVQARKNDVTHRLLDLALQLDECNVAKKRIDAEWRTLWVSSEMQPSKPREMRAWLDKLDKLSDRVEQLHSVRQKLSDHEQSRDTHIQLLQQQLHALGKEGEDTPSLEAVVSEGERVADDLMDVHQQREALDKEIKTLERHLESAISAHRAASGELDAWQEQWKKEAIAGFNLHGDASPSEVADLIEKLRDLFAKQSEAEKLRIRIQAIDEEAESFREQVGNVVAGIAPELIELAVDEAVVRLNTLLSENRARQSRRQQIEEQMLQTQQDIKDSEATIKTMTDRLNALCVEAKCDSHADLEEADYRSIEYLKIKAAIGAIEQAILEAGEGASLAILEEEAKGIDPDVLPGQISELSTKIDAELEPRRTELAQAKGRKEKELELMDGSDDAAALAERAQAVLAAIRADAERYVRVKLAARVLRDEIERYRKENQGPLVKRASEYFSVLTYGSFEGLRIDFNPKDEPVLAGIRPGGERVYVEGMSSGTRDQLYLALRLASLEKYMESSEPMPFIVDDVLVDFDDKRSEAALNALAVLAERTQVVVFTHHSQVVQQANSLQGAAQVQIHEL